MAETTYEKWYKEHREERLEYLKEYMRKRKVAFEALTEEEKEKMREERNAKQRESYKKRTARRILSELEELKTTADERYVPLIQSLIDDKKYETLTPDGLKEFKKLVRFVV